jgi:antitoxin (DNA-binding transcriptional repressor) of toxin-antitoxin stability system
VRSDNQIRQGHAHDDRDRGLPELSDLLDAIERGETITITRGHHAVAEMKPARRRTGTDLKAALGRIPPPDDRFAADIAAALALLSSDGSAPWAGV